MIKKLLVLCVTVTVVAAWFMTGHASKKDQVDLVVFSYDRPLQLYAFLESVQKHVTGLKTVAVIYRTSDQEYTAAYRQVAQKFSHVNFLQQSTLFPQQDFKPLLMKASFESPGDYIVYGVDDIVVTDHVDMHRVVASLEKTGAYGFFLRLGTHLTESYMNSCSQKVPPLTKVDDDVYAWTFNQAEFDWAYPTSQDMTVYRKKDVDFLLKQLSFYSPNSCEAQWYGCYDFSKKQGLCFSSAKIVNIPMNMVQVVRPNNRSMNLFSVQDLLAKFNEGLKMDIQPLFKAQFNSVHVEYVPTFVQRA